MSQSTDSLRTAAMDRLQASLGPKAWAEWERSATDPAAPIPRRPLGKTGDSLSVVGFGGIVVMGLSQDEANRRVAQAIDRGVNYFDVAPTYGDGEAEAKLGPALRPHRDKAFLACKTGKRDKQGAAESLRKSLKTLQTDHFDLYQMHAIQDVEKDVERALGPGGAIEAFLEARDQGLVRHIGFSAHSIEAALKAIDSGLFETILMPVNFVCHHQGRFDPTPLAAARKRGMGMLALKSLALAPWPKGTKRDERGFPKCWYQPIDEPLLAALALRWTLCQGITAAIPPGDERLFRMALDVAGKDAPLTDAEEQALRAVASQLAPLFAAAA
jgi:aryl-alcohol dehydrogenase-like predicted oxidoreductase